MLGIAKQWQFWVLPLGYFFVQSSLPVQQPNFALWLKANGHSVYQRNVWPTGQLAIGVVVQLAGGMISDSPLLKGRRWPILLVMQAGTLVGVSILAAWNVSDRVKYFAYYISYFSAGAPGPYYAWYSDLIPHDHEMRGFVIAASNMFSYINTIWYTIAAWRTVEAPRFRAGFTACAIFGAAMISLTIILKFLQDRDNRKRSLEGTATEDVERPEAALPRASLAEAATEAIADGVTPQK